MNNLTIAVGSIGLVLVILAFAIVQDSLEGALVDWYNSGTLVGVRGGGNFIGQNGVQATSTDSAANDRVDFALSVDLVTTGADGDSTTTTTASGLEIVSSELTILRGCNDDELLLWDEAVDEWRCFTPQSRETQFLTVRKGSPGTINVGEAVFISGFNIGQSVPEVELAENDVTASMPAIGLAFESITNSANTRVVISGRLSGAIDTSAFTAGDTIYISSTAGEVTATRPTAAGEQVQSMGLVLRSNASQGQLEIVGAGRANDTPNTAFDPAITWGTGSGFTWTFDAGATDPTIDYASDDININAASVDFSGSIDVLGGTVENTGGNLTVQASAGNDVLLGDDSTLLRIDGGANAVHPLVDIDFQQAAEISTTSGGLTLDPASDVFMPDGKTLVIGHNAVLSVLGNTGAALQVLENNNGPSSRVTVVNFQTADDPPSVIFGKGSGGVIGTFTAIITGASLGSLSFTGADGDDMNTSSASISAVAEGTIGPDRIPSRLVFSTGTDAAPTVRTEALRLDSNQDMLPSGDLDFQQAAEISTTAGGLTLSPNSTVVTSTASINPAADSTYDLGIQTTFQWANLWADLVNGADYAYVNGWRTLESEKYEGYPKGIAFANTCFTDGIVTETMPPDCTPVFVVTEDFVEFNGQRFFSGMPLTQPSAQPAPAPGGVSNALAAMLLIGLLATLGVVVWQYRNRVPAALSFAKGSDPNENSHRHHRRASRSDNVVQRPGRPNGAVNRAGGGLGDPLALRTP